MPAHTPAHKQPEGDPGPRHRLRMSQLLVDEADGLSACPLEIERGGVSYTVDTLNAIHASHPDAELTFIVGADTARTLADLAGARGAARAGGPCRGRAARVRA